MANEEEWKDSIHRNYSYFIENIADPHDVAQYLFGQTNPPIIMHEHLGQIKAERTPSKQVEKMLNILLIRGPMVPQCLFDAFVETHNEECAKKLAPYLLAQEKHALKKTTSEWPPLHEEHFDMKKVPVTYLKPNDPCCFLQYNNTDEVYSMRRKRRGLVYLINNEKFDDLPRRYGTEFDRDDLAKLFTDLYFEVIVYDNLTAEEIRKNTESISKCDKIKDCDCFIFIILTHGDEKGVCGIDGESVPVSTLTEMFEPNNCPELNEKPKVFLIQACRGDKKQKVCPSGGPGENGSQGDGSGDHVDGMNASDGGWELGISATQTVHSKSDFLVAYSTPEGSLSWRKMDAGSWFMQAIVWVFKSESHVKDLVEMLGKVNDIVSKGKAKSGWGHYVTVSKNYSYFKNNIADPLDVAEYLFGETNPPIITDNQKEQIKAENTTSKKVGKMLDILMKRGPRVPQCLFDAFMETHNEQCAKKLAPYLLAQEKHALKREPSEWPPLHEEHFDMMKEPVTYLRPNDPCCFLQYNNTDEVYSMRRECRGLVYLINNEQFHTLSQRDGTKFDRDNLKKLFTDLHFEVIVENNLTAEEIRKKTESISKCDKIKDSDCFIFIILTHGDEKGVCGIDGISVPVTTLTEMFEPNNCPEMNEKPKIFLIQACRGGESD
uniref:Caspase-6 n=1 Tax=Magallana gigas TaxID=29159 RepID=K1R808_MAGGI